MRSVIESIDRGCNQLVECPELCREASQVAIAVAESAVVRAIKMIERDFHIMKIALSMK